MCAAEPKGDVENVVEPRMAAAGSSVCERESWGVARLTAAQHSLIVATYLYGFPESLRLLKSHVV